MSEKTKCILSYIFGWLGGLIVLYAVNDNEKNTKFHAAQAIVMSVAYMVLTAIVGFIPVRIPFLATGLWALYMVGVIFGIVKANKNEEPELPVVGDLTKSIFSKILEK